MEAPIGESVPPKDNSNGEDQFVPTLPIHFGEVYAVPYTINPQGELYFLLGVRTYPKKKQWVARFPSRKPKRSDESLFSIVQSIVRSQYGADHHVSMYYWGKELKSIVTLKRENEKAHQEGGYFYQAFCPVYFPMDLKISSGLRLPLSLTPNTLRHSTWVPLSYILDPNEYPQLARSFGLSMGQKRDVLLQVAPYHKIAIERLCAMAMDQPEDHVFADALVNISQYRQYFTL